MFGFDYFVPLDLRTLFRLIFITDVVVCLVLLTYQGQSRERPIVHRFVFARSLHAIGCLLLGFRGEIPPELSIDLANALVYFGFAIELSILVSMRAPNALMTPLLLVVAGVGSFVIVLTAGHLDWIVGVAGLTVALLFAPSAYLLAVAPSATRLQYLIASFCGALAVTFLMRAYAGFVEGRTTLDRSLLQFLGLIFMYGYAVAGGMGFLLLMKEEDDRRLRKAATTDFLTGILNRGAFFDAARLALEAATRERRAVSLLLIDVDHFKRVNDTYGHPVGDLVLQGLTGAIAERVRTTDIFGRLGGEEFAVLLVGAQSTPEALAVAERLRLSARELKIEGGPENGCSISIGCAVQGPNALGGLDRLMHRCDEALYAAKRNGRDRVILADEVVTAVLGAAS